MQRNTLARELQSSEKEGLNGQSDQISAPSAFWFPMYEGIFEHAPDLKDAVWLFMWLIARTTREPEGHGSVLGGIPVSDERPASELGFTVKTIRRWRRMLVLSGYISLNRAARGYRYTLLKSKKWQKQRKSDLPKLPITSEGDLPLRASRVPGTGNHSVCILKDNTGTTQKVSHDGRTDGLTLTGKTWEELKIKNLPGRFRGFVRVAEANPPIEDERLVVWGKYILDLCDERQIEYPRVFLKRIKDAERNVSDEHDPYGEIARVATRSVKEEIARLEKLGLRR